MNKKIKDIIYIIFLSLILGLVIPVTLYFFQILSKNSTIIIDGCEYSVNSETIRLFPETDEFINKISYFVNLKELTVIPFKRSIKVMSSSEGDKEKIEKIMDGYTDVNDLSCIKNQTQLEYLNISYCSVVNADFIYDMSELKTLIISNTEITDISFIVNLKKLEIFDCSNCLITDYSYLLYCESLNSVYISKDKIDKFMVERLMKNGISIIESE